MTVTPTTPANGSADPVHGLLSDGTTVEIRPPRRDDRGELVMMFAKMSPDSFRNRFFTSGRGTGDLVAERLTDPEPDRIALLAVAHRAGTDTEEIVGEAEAWTLGDGVTAEIAFTVAEGMRGRGVGTLLLEHLADAGRARGIQRFAAETMRTNLAMNRVIAAAGLHHSEENIDGGTVFHDIDLTVDVAYLDRVADREFHASAASLRPLLRPRAIAVVGAGRKTGGVGRVILDHLVAAGFGGPLFAVNPNADVIDVEVAAPARPAISATGSEAHGEADGDIAHARRPSVPAKSGPHGEFGGSGAATIAVPCARSVALLPQPVDLAVIAVPADKVVEAAIDCGRHGIRALTIVTSSVSASARTVLHAVCRRFGMRLVGPNCLGLAAFGPGVSMDATFAADVPLPGSAGVAVQSGGVGIAILDHLSRLGIGVGSFASLGDKADVSGNDLLAWWSQDPATKMALLHLESFGNPRKFARYARRVARTKPVLTVGAGRSAAGSRAAASHTAAAVTPTITRDALFRQAGVIPARSVAELVETAALLSAQPLPGGCRIAVVSNAGGTGVLAADACVEAGLKVDEFSAGLRERLDGLLGPAAACANPVDAGAAAGVGELRAAVETIAASGEADAVLLLLVPTALADLRPVLTEGVEHSGCPLIAVLVNQPSGIDIVTTADRERIPVYGDAEEAARALAHACSYGDWLRTPEGKTPELPGIRAQDAARIASLYLTAHPDGGWLPPDRAADLLSCYGIRCPRTILARNEQTAVTTAAIWGGPVALKAYWPELVHKSDVGGVLLGLEGEQAVREGFRTLGKRFGERLVGVVVQEMAPSGVELLAGVDSDEVFGPLIGFGVGGTDTDIADDHNFRLAPLTDTDAASLINGSRAARMLAGFRGRPGGDAEAVQDVLLRLARLAADQPCVAEAEVNPLMATPDGAVAADFRIRIAPRTATDPYLRRLR